MIEQKNILVAATGTVRDLVERSLRFGNATNWGRCPAGSRLVLMPSFADSLVAALTIMHHPVNYCAFLAETSIEELDDGVILLNEARDRGHRAPRIIFTAGERDAHERVNGWSDPETPVYAIRARSCSPERLRDILAEVLGLNTRPSGKKVFDSIIPAAVL